MSEPPGGSAGGAPRLGSMFGRYRIESVVGRGGMGVVVRATDTRLDRIVALKFIAPELAGDPVVHERFMRESRSAAAIEHPNIVPIHEAGEAEGTLFLAMRAIAGPDLATVLRREAPLDRTRTLAIATPLADALDAAHRRGLIHRDVKPGNVLLEPGEDGGPERPWLTDFGLTRRLAETAPLTAGGPLGTIDYLAPELIDGGEVGPWTDQYSLACLIVHCLTGAPPWQGPTDAAVLYAHVHADRASLLGRVAGDQVAAVLARGLATRAEDRFPDCRALVAALASAMAADPRAGVAVGVSDRTDGPVGLAPDAAPSAASIRHDAVDVATSRPPDHDAPAEGRDHRLEPATGPTPVAGAGSERPTTQGSSSVPVVGHGGRARRRPGRTPLVLAMVAVLTAGVLLAATSGTPVTTPEPTRSAQPSGPTGSGGLQAGHMGGDEGVIVFSGGAGDELDLWAILPDGDAPPVRLTSMPGMERWPSVSPDGRWLVFSAGPEKSRNLWLLPLDTLVPQQLTRNRADDYAPALSPDGSQLLWVSDRSGNIDIWMMEDLGEGFGEAEPQNLTARARAGFMADVFPSWDPGGGAFAFASNRAAGADIWWLDLARRAPRALTRDALEFSDMSPTVGPGGDVVFVGRRDHPDRELYRVVPGSDPEKITSYGEDVSAPAFSPDGSRLVAAVGRMVDLVDPAETRLVLMSREGARQGGIRTGFKVATDPDWVDRLDFSPAAPSPSPSPSPVP